MHQQTHFYLPAWFWWAFFVVCFLVSTWGIQRRLAERRADRWARKRELARWERLGRECLRQLRCLTARSAVLTPQPSVPDPEPEIPEASQLDAEIDAAVDRLFNSTLSD